MERIEEKILLKQKSKLKLNLSLYCKTTNSTKNY